MQTAPAPLEAVRTDGSRIELADGRSLVDGIASWWTACHGYNHPHIREAVTAQLARMPHVMLGGLVHAPVTTLADRLAALLPGDLEHAFFSESGSVAVEVAMKMALQWWMNQGQPQRRRFLSFLHGYHGDTFAAMSVCDPDEGMHAKFAGSLPQQLVAALPRTDAEFAVFERLLAQHAHVLAALLIEPLIQGAGGMKFHTAQILARIVELARRHDVLLVFDEIATGFGRTGSMFACEQAGVVPDIVTLSKALTGGTLALAVTVARSHIYEGFLSDDPALALMHGPTFAGNPLACAAANASLDLFETEPRLAQAARIETQLREGLESCRALAGVRDVRVKGACGVVQLDVPPDHARLRQQFVERGVWIRPFGDVVYLMPALTISEDELEQLRSAIYSVLGG
jgi:adenosylmethionine-8-amino-7-oxononanoate aminotransferase